MRDHAGQALSAASTDIQEFPDGAAWDACVRAAPDASFAHLWGWRDVIADTIGHEPVYRVIRGADRAVDAVLPLYRVRSSLFGSHLVSVPFMNYGGPAGNPAAVTPLAGWAIEEAQRTGARKLLLRTRYPTVTLPARVAATKVTAVLPLPATAEAMWNGSFDAKFRNKIKRPQRDGMQTRFGVAELGAFYDVFARNMRDLGTPVLPRAFFERIVSTFPDLVLIGATYWNEMPVAAGFGFVWRNEFEMTWSSSRKELRAAKPNMLLYWDYMRALIGRGVERFNFGRSTPGSGPHEFKRSWGAVDEPLPWIQWPDSGGASDQSRAATFGAAVWSRLPIGVANAFGPFVARQLPWW